jgi:hypothetical protein
MTHLTGKSRKRSLGPKSRWVLFLASLALAFLAGLIMLVAGLNARARGPVVTPAITATPVPAGPTVQVSPLEGGPGMFMVAVGEGWQPGDELSVYVEALSDDRETRVLVTLATVDEDGGLIAPFYFPSDERLIDLPQVVVAVRSPTTGDEAMTVLRVSEADQTPLPPPSATPAPTATEPVTTPEPTPEPTTQPQPSPTPTPAAVGCVDRASFVSDVTIPDNTHVPAGQSFVKTWRLRNSGTCIWTADYALAFVDGHTMGGPSSVPLRAPVAPGETVDLSVTLTAPAGNGTYEGRWRLRNADGELFGTGSTSGGAFWVRIIVGPTPTPQPTITAWRGEYFSNASLVGTPALVRNDTGVDFNWGYSAPATGIPADGFSARWTRVLWFEGRSYRFHTVVDDGVRLYVDNTLVIDAWYDGPRREVTGDRTLAAGNHTVRIEYYERSGEAALQVWWEKLAQYPDWKGEYWSNRSLSGSPALVRNDTIIDFDWGKSAPAANLPADGFSARWTRTAEFDAATYRFQAKVDDGVRLWVDDQLIIDAWQDGAVRELTADHALVRGTHRLRVEYYERTGDARIRVRWEKVTPSSYPDWKGEYWSNRSLSGSPALVRNDREIDFRWGTGAPAVGLPADDFSARWTRKLGFQPGVYRFYARADDGVRFTLDGRLMIGEWHASSGQQVYTADAAFRNRNEHQLVVEYHERSGNALIEFWWTRTGALPTPQPAVNKPPVAMDDSAMIDEDNRAYINVLANDSDPDGDALTISQYDVLSVKGGGVSCTSAGMCTYDPPTNFNGNDAFSYTVSDGKGHSDRGTATVTVNPVNDPPVAADDSAATNVDTSATINVLANDSDPDGDTLIISDYDTYGREGGTVRCTGAGVCTYTPPEGFSGSDSFIYTASDGSGSTDSATVTVVVNRVNGPPVAVDDSVTTLKNTPVDVNVLGNDSDPDGDALIVSDYQPSSAQGGTVRCTDGGMCTYSPPVNFIGRDDFAYTISDGNGGTDSASVTVTVANQANNLPTGTGVRLNEVLPVPAAVDWDGDGSADERDEWIELHNAGPAAADIGGWFIGTSLSQAVVYAMPEGTVLQPGAFAVLYRARTGIVLDDRGGQVRLIDLRGEVADKVAFGALGADTSYSRDGQGAWHSNWAPSPGAPNLPPGSTPGPGESEF